MLMGVLAFPDSEVCVHFYLVNPVFVNTNINDCVVLFSMLSFLTLFAQAAVHASAALSNLIIFSESGRVALLEADLMNTLLRLISDGQPAISVHATAAVMNCAKSRMLFYHLHCGSDDDSCVKPIRSYFRHYVLIFDSV